MMKNDMSYTARKRIVILGGGFGGIYAALRLEKALARDPTLEVTLRAPTMSQAENEPRSPAALVSNV
ncbi:MAG: hypothetical protein DMD87_04755 [Candidatus Rokuibacteriota bacterium]|nr:MAG: hypothetical protein DMD87_04755 [Candidatus Rokubacteria bacterium]